MAVLTLGDPQKNLRVWMDIDIGLLVEVCVWQLKKMKKKKKKVMKERIVGNETETSSGDRLNYLVVWDEGME